MQAFVQAIGFTSGLLVLTFLPTEEYALYTIANSLLVTMCGIGDAGVATGVMAQGGKVWQDKKRLGEVLLTGKKFRAIFSKIGLCIGLPILFLMLQNQGASMFTSAAVALSITPAFLASLNVKLLSIAPLLHQDTNQIQRLQIASNGIRLLLTAAINAVFPFAAIAFLVTGVAQSWWSHRLKKSLDQYAEPASEEDPIVREAIYDIVKRTLPSSLYFSLSLQLSVYILAILGATNSVAQLGAISRITIVTSIYASVFSYIIAPRFARLNVSNAALKKRFLQVQGAVILMCLLAYLPAFHYATQILRVLPSDYHGLTYVFRMHLASCTIGVLITTLTALNSSRGYVLKPTIHIPLNLAILLVAAWVIRPQSLMGVIQFDLLRAIVAPVVQNAIFFTHARNGN